MPCFRGVVKSFWPLVGKLALLGLRFCLLRESRKPLLRFLLDFPADLFSDLFSGDLFDPAES